MHLFKKSDPNNNFIQVGRNLLDVDLSRVVPNMNNREKDWTKPLPFEKSKEPYEYCQKDHRDKFYTRDAFLNQPLKKDIYSMQSKSSDAYGWYPPIDNHIHLKFGISTYEGGVDFNKAFRGTTKPKEEAP